MDQRGMPSLVLTLMGKEQKILEKVASSRIEAVNSLPGRIKFWHVASERWLMMILSLPPW